MRARQREVAEVMIEIGIMPIGRIVAGSTVRAILAIMFIILLMAGVAVHGRAFVLPVHGRISSHLGVLAFQFERCQIVIELGRSPAVRFVTLTAIQPEATLMRLIVMVTGVAILQRDRKVAQATRVDMTLHTGKINMFARQLE
jgi:hypothetical protein